MPAPDPCDMPLRLSTIGAIAVSGEDRIPFLQGQLTQDITQLTPNRPLFAGWNSPKGRLLCTLWLVTWQDTIWLLLPAELAAETCKRLRLFILRAGVQIEAHANRVSLITAPRGATLANSLPDNNASIICTYDDSSYYFYPDGKAWPGLLLSRDVAPETDVTGADHSWRAASIRAGRPVIFAATREAFVPQMVNLDLLSGISFTKGCYVGQEIVARTQNLGRIKRRMFRFRATTSTQPMPGDPVYAGSKSSGKVVDAVVEGDGWEGLAVIALDSISLPLSLNPDGSGKFKPEPLPYRIPEADR